MRKRGKRGPNDSESTGKVGHQIPANQPAPIQPVYPPRPGAAVPSESGPESPDRAKPLPVADVPVETVASPRDRFAGNRGHAERSSAEPHPAESHSPGPHSDEQVSPAELPSAAPKGYMVLAIGLPGSGKTTWFKRRGVTPLSSDMLRGILFDDVNEQRHQSLVFSTLRSLLRARMIARMPWNYVDATNLSAHERRQWIKMAKSFGYEAQAVFFDVSCEICMERNRRRDRFVDEETMRKLAERLRPPSFKEGFTKITMVRVKGAEQRRQLSQPQEPDL